MPLIKRGPSDTLKASATPVEAAAQLVSGSPAERWSAARALAQAPDAVDLLSDALATEKAPEVREAIFTSLVLIHTHEAAAALASIIRSDDAQLRTGALDALCSIIDVARPLLPGLLNDPDPDVRLLSCELVRPLDPVDGSALLSEMLEAEHAPNVCGAAVDVLSEIGVASASDTLRECAARFADDPYLAFAIADAIERTSKRPARDG